MLKLSKTTWLVLFTGIAAAAIGMVILTHSRQLEEKSHLADELAMSETLLGKLDTRALTEQKATLELQRDEALAELATARAPLDYPVDSIQETDAVFRIADDCNVTITDLTTSGNSQGSLAGLSTTVINLTVKAEGTVPALIDFITALNTDFTTAEVRSADIAIPEVSADRAPSAAIRLTVYGCQEG